MIESRSVAPLGQSGWRRESARIRGGMVLGFERSTRDRYLMGVCGGLAHSLGWNSNLVRAITALAGLIIPGVSFILVAIVYVVLGFVLPENRNF